MHPPMPVCPGRPMRPPRILAISSSRKSGRSTSRAVLAESVRMLGGVYPNVEMLDLCDVQVPFSAGLSPQTLASGDFQSVLRAVGESAGLLLSVPCYWGS